MRYYKSLCFKNSFLVELGENFQIYETLLSNLGRGN